MQRLSAYMDIRNALGRHRNVRYIPVPDPLAISEALTVTQGGREVDAGDVNSDERFLLHTGQDGKLLIFCASAELSVLYQTE